MVSVEGPGDAADVWRRYTSPSAWPGWAPQIRGVDTAHDPVRAGATGVVHGPLLVRVPFRVLGVDQVNRRWSWFVGLGPVGVRMEHGVDELATGSRAWVQIHAPAFLVLAYRPVATLALRRVVAS